MACSNSPCAACKFLRRKCLPGCMFSPYFPPEEPQKFANVHKIFGASNVTKLLNEIPQHQREDAVNSLAYEAEARIKDPVYGCVGVISVLQKQVHRLKEELNVANTNLIHYAFCNESSITTISHAFPAVTSISRSSSSSTELNKRISNNLVNEESSNNLYDLHRSSFDNNLELSYLPPP